ncbi:hypothetical protein AHAS_Ahas13G0317300 [Arachis hypogaea]
MHILKVYQKVSTKMRIEVSVGWTGSQKRWSCLLEQIIEIERYGSSAFSLPILQEAVFIFVIL